MRFQKILVALNDPEQDEALSKHAPCLTIVVPWDGTPPIEYSPGEATE